MALDDGIRARIEAEAAAAVVRMADLLDGPVVRVAYHTGFVAGATAEAERAQALVEAAEAVVAAYSQRWVRVDCTPDEERTLRELNDVLNTLGHREEGDA